MDFSDEDEDRCYLAFTSFASSMVLPSQEIDSPFDIFATPTKIYNSFYDDIENVHNFYRTCMAFDKLFEEENKKHFFDTIVFSAEYEKLQEQYLD